ncbi:MAG: DUF1573 domain-containing protein [Rikenellaceae bacterium]
MKAILLVISLLFIQSAVWAQPLKFSASQWNFGTIAEDGGDVSHTFEFTNATDKPIVITDIKTTCGCTTPQYSKQPIAAGAQSTIEITYDPMYRPGVFSRDITIYTSASNDPMTIKISGDATPRKLSVERQYPYILLDGVRISSLYSPLGNVSPDSPQQGQWEVINISKERHSIDFRVKNAALSHLKIEAPSSLEAGESAVVNIRYELPAQGGVYGELNDYVDGYVDGKKSRMQIRVRGYAVDNFDPSSKKGVSRALFSENFINFGAFSRRKDNLSKRLTIENRGTESIHIRAIECPEGVEVVSKQGMEITPKGKLNLSVNLLREGIELGSMVKYITFILNDPDQPVVRVKVVGEVSE